MPAKGILATQLAHWSKHNPISRWTIPLGQQTDVVPPTKAAGSFSSRSHRAAQGKAGQHDTRLQCAKLGQTGTVLDTDLGFLTTLPQRHIYCSQLQSQPLIQHDPSPHGNCRSLQIIRGSPRSMQIMRGSPTHAKERPPPAPATSFLLHTHGAAGRAIAAFQPPQDVQRMHVDSLFPAHVVEVCFFNSATHRTNNSNGRKTTA